MSTFTLRGDGHDLAEKFEDTLRELISDNNVFEFMSEDIDAPEPSSVDNETVRQKQREQASGKWSLLSSRYIGWTKLSCMQGLARLNIAESKSL